MRTKQINQFVTASYQKNREAPTNIDNYELDKELSTRKAKVYHDPNTNKTVVANRGTASSISDWKNNLDYITGNYDKTDRLKKANRVQDQAIQKYGKVDTNVTHSQSAIIGRKLNEQGKTGQVIEVNPAIMFEKQKKNEHIIKSKYDPVSVLTNVNPFLKKENITEIGNNTMNPLTEHSADVLQRIDTEVGNGLKVGFNNETSGDELDEMCKNISEYHGCFIKDQLPKLQNGFYIVNLNGHSHWCALYIDGDNNYYFDPFGFVPPTEVEDKIKPYYYNDEQIQDMNDSSCGYYCIGFIKFMNHKVDALKSYNDFIHLFSQDSKDNEKILSALI